jgi:Histidine kinase-, DNA gyrase B-, and HSP90-like ATPase
MGSNGLYETSTQPAVRVQERCLEPERTNQQLPATDDLEVAFSRIPQEGWLGAEMICLILINGRTRGLNTLVRHGAYRIGREALLNAFRHSAATRVEVELEYAPKRLRITIRDNGKGIRPEFFHSGCRGHRGLSEMKYLAEQIGAQLKVMSRVAAGTEIELSIPGHVAFVSQTSSRRPGWANAWSRIASRGWFPKRAISRHRPVSTLTVEDRP